MENIPEVVQAFQHKLDYLSSLGLDAIFNPLLDFQEGIQPPVDNEESKDLVEEFHEVEGREANVRNGNNSTWFETFKNLCWNAFTTR